MENNNSNCLILRKLQSLGVFLSHAKLGMCMQESVKTQYGSDYNGAWSLPEEFLVWFGTEMGGLFLSLSLFY